MKIEWWTAIEGYEGKYYISNFGRVCTFYHNRFIIKVLGFNKKTGYLVTSFYKDKKHHSYNLHKLVAKYFLPNPHNYNCVNHKNECKTDNIVFIDCDGTVDFDRSNLEWCTHRYNDNYGQRPQKLSVSLRGNQNGKKHS